MREGGGEEIGSGAEYARGFGSVWDTVCERTGGRKGTGGGEAGELIEDSLSGEE